MEDDLSHPMETPGPVLAGIAILAVLILGTLMAIDTFWQASGPVTMATPPTPAPSHAGMQQAAPPATPAPPPAG
jgi:hypothetical protein